MVEEIITALSRIRWLFVIARNSSFTYKGQAIDVKQVGRELGVRYVLEGSVRKGGNRVRITAQLIDAETGAHLWADRFDGSLEDVFDLQAQGRASASPGSSSRRCRRPRPPARPAARRAISAHTTSICVLMRCILPPPKTDAEGAGAARGGHRPRPAVSARHLAFAACCCMHSGSDGDAPIEK